MQAKQNKATKSGINVFLNFSFVASNTCNQVTLKLKDPVSRSVLEQNRIHFTAGWPTMMVSAVYPNGGVYFIKLCQQCLKSSPSGAGAFT
jgi:hypothetical protein